MSDHGPIDQEVGPPATERANDINRMDLDEFRTGGYLQEVNRRFLHPLGLALEVTVDGNDRVIALGGIWDYRDDPEGMNYAPDMIDPVKIDKVAEEWLIHATVRRAQLGYVIQPR